MWLNSIMVGWLMYDCGAYQLYPSTYFYLQSEIGKFDEMTSIDSDAQFNLEDPDPC